MVEALTVLELLWSGKKVSFNGKFFQLSDTHIGIKPIQVGGPPIWIAASSDIAIKRSARLGYPWLIHHADYPTVERQIDLYNSARQVAGHPQSPVQPIVREFFVAETREQAYAECGPFLTGKYDTYSQWGQDLALPGEKSFQTTFEELSRDRFVVGSVEDVISDIRRYQDLGVTHMGLRIRWAGMPVEPTVRCMELVGKHIIPQFSGDQNSMATY
jgi:alkanesulfonate monooxygenase SsuD/methylene tetrahydromethanopterin reductase-like flavin-dependent oxidoreductase (luciferase family)